MRWGRTYFAVQAIAGAAWWIAVFTFPFVRDVTLGGLNPIVVAAFDIPLFVGASALAALGVRAAAVVSTCWTVVVTIALAGYATVTGEAGWGVVIMAAATAGSALALCLVVVGRIPTDWMIRGPFAFRPAAVRPAAATHVVATFMQIAVFWGLFLVVIPLIAALLEQRWAIAIPLPAFAGPVGVAVLVAASALGIWSAVVMSTLGNGTPLPSAMPNSLVIAGPYRWVRNPMAVSGIVQGVAVGLILSSWLVIVYAIAGSMLWNYAIRPHEEADLERRFGAEFRRYRDAVRCWLPRVPVAPSSP
ncbi:isoprenylcysteine carboxylmethyltransferase family protein [Cryobacterium adonitolivorans]|uniref:Isoprenylcysteine carboxylmethyltransferase family protein n=1 Tax=Cryobacterium adonitolivorans TaxID=1259189 RepID=A0A4R8WDB4_9MICO|nr:isoprenylcysteine carboxylmethyltransferase family protein [Cryobacterium adonitolivorans]TFC06957.1 isoprenylcysteine carboxylmethyltransferase family protein [Cryobacterium adonitolivorans]